MLLFWSNLLSLVHFKTQFSSELTTPVISEIDFFTKLKFYADVT